MFASPGRPVRYTSLAFAAVCLCFAVASGTAHAQSNQVTISRDNAGAVIQFNRAHKGPVAVSLDGRRIARGSHTPLRVRLSVGELNRTSRPRLVLRDLRTGRPLVIRYLQRQASSAPALRHSPARQLARILTVTTRPTSPTTSTTAKIAWRTGAATRTTCSLDGAPATSCVSPANLTGLTVGSHTFTIAASTRSAKTESTVRWTVNGTAPAPTPVPTPAAVAAPISPSAYPLPTGAVWVRNAAELATALAGPTLDIVLADGTYDQAAPFINSDGHRLYAEHLGQAVLRTGIVLGGNFGRSGAVVRGLSFDVSAPSKAFGGGIVHVWGNSGTGAQVLDCTFRGGGAVSFGLLALNPSGLRVERSQFFAFTDVAVRLSDNVSVAYGSSTPVIESVQDILVDGVSRPVPGSSNGTAEAGLWVGHPVRNGVHRVQVRNVSWSGIQTVNNAWDTSFDDLDVDMGGSRQAAGVGVYMEHYTRNVTFDRVNITGVKIGFAGEWADPSWGGLAGAHNVKIRTGVIDSAGSTLPGRQAGVYLDEGTESITVTGLTFKNQNWAGIGAYRNIGSNSFTQNTFAMDPGAVQISTEHI